MKVAVFGAGGVGAFYGGLLAGAGHDVHFIARGAQLEALRTRGLRISSLALGEITVPPVSATARAGDIGIADLVLVCVKAHQTTGILEQVAPLLGEHTIVMALQNGVESDEVLSARFGAERVLSAVVYVGATLEEPGHVRHVAAGTLVIGDRHGASSERLERVREVLASTGLPVRVSPDIERQRWHKLAWNASFNAISALTLRSSQDLLANPSTRALLVGMMREVVAVAHARGVTLGEADIEQLVAATEKSAAIRTSMLVDRERGRQLETDALVGVVVRKGKEAGVPTPIAEVLYALLTAIGAPEQEAPQLPPMEAGSFSPQS
jgi:2-dehydropantoate 2-reductase